MITNKIKLSLLVLLIFTIFINLSSAQTNILDESGLNTTQSWNRTQLYNTTQIDNFNASWSSTYNATYDAKISFNNTNLAYLNNSVQQWTGQQNFTTNITITKGLVYDNGTCTFIQRGNNKWGICG